MYTFWAYFNLGIRHFSNINSVEHILFLLALCTIYLMRDWKKVMLLILCYSIAYITTLLLSTFDLIRIPAEVAEYLISWTVFLTAAWNLFRKQYGSASIFQLSYFPAFFFGLVHGLGFAGYFKSILNRNTDIGFQVFSFIIGIETSQVLIATLFLIVSWLFVNNFGVNRRDWVLVISSGIAGIGLTFMFEARFWIQ
jgi:hypothetical protein